MKATKLFQEMSAEERLQWATRFGEFLHTEWPALEVAARAKQVQWSLDLQRRMERLVGLLMAWSFARDFCEKAVRYGDYAARAYRMPVYIEKVQQLVAQTGDEQLTKAVCGAEHEKPRRGRPASAETIARREAEAKAAQQQVALFGDSEQPAGKPAGTVAHSAPVGSAGGVKAASPAAESQGAVATPVPFIGPTSREDAEYRVSIAQKRGFLLADLQAKSDTIRALRSQHAAASERAKTMSDMKADPKAIEPVAREAIEAHDAYTAIYAEIDAELGTLWYRLQNDSPEWRDAWCRRYGFKSATDLHPDLLHDLRKHYQKVQSPEFDLRCRTLIEQESPEYIARQAKDAAKKKEVQDILRYLKRKDKGQKLETARAKFRRLEELLGKKDAADYRPLLTKIEGDAKAAEKAKKK